MDFENVVVCVHGCDFAALLLLELFYKYNALIGTLGDGHRVYLVHLVAPVALAVVFAELYLLPALHGSLSGEGLASCPGLQ